MKKLKLLIFIKPFPELYPKHKHKYDMIRKLEKFAQVQFWGKDGNAKEILNQIYFRPDFIIQYETKKAFSPTITGLNQVSVPKGFFIIDPQSNIKERQRYIEKNKIDLIFSVTKKGFLKYYPEYQEKMRWVPFSVNTEAIKDWKLQKDIDFLLMGLIFIKNKSGDGGYSFREAVLNRMKDVEGFKYIPHPGHCAKQSKDLIVNEKYGQLMNRGKIFLTCGSVRNYPVAKFFEAPGCRTLLLAKPNRDVFELGFIDGVNFVACDENDFYEKAMYYYKHKEKREEITDNGYRFIQANHTNQVRAKQFIRYIEEFIMNSEV